ncbi:MAG: outer membrane protein assembly factor BamA [Chlamydiales bacterium]|nr:outer membrane protein assembly factor BamA [Chlamydiales bacterium]
MSSKRHISSYALLAFLFLTTTGSIHGDEFYEEKRIFNIEIIVDAPESSSYFDGKPILSRLKTQEGDEFSQTIFDQDLKLLSQEYDRVDPSIQIKNGQLVITIHVTPRPLIHQIVWRGNERYNTSRLQRELNIQPYTVFNRQTFNKAFNKIKEFYIKKGYFESQISYSLESIPNTNQVDVIIDVKEGKSGNIKKIVFKGFTKQEQSDLSDQMFLKKYNFLTSWVTGSGIFRDEALDQDRATIVNYLHNKGYADARVDVELTEDSHSGKLIVEITAHRGTIYKTGSVQFEGNTLISSDEIEKKCLLHAGEPYSPEKVRDTAQLIKDLYGQKGYIDASVQFEADLEENQPVFDVRYIIEEGQQYKIGLIYIFGNHYTKNNVLLRESLLVPGETFDSRKLKATQQRLEAMGYFKSVNVYAVRTSEDLGETYRDVYIEVEETTTGSVNLFMGFSTIDDIFGGLEITERNFRIAGLGKAWSDVSALRGGGEYFHIRGTLGKKQNNVLISWMDPYINDSLWRFGTEITRTYSKLQEDTEIITYGGSVFTSYPINMFWTFGMRERLRHSHDFVDLKAFGTNTVATDSYNEQKRLLDQEGLVSAFSSNLSYDSTDNPFKPHRGWRSLFEAEIAGVGGSFYFGKVSYLNSIYFPIWAKGTLKLKAEFKYIFPYGQTARNAMPYSERLFMGGENTVRGYKPFMLGPLVKLLDDNGIPQNTHTPNGGNSATLFSLEYNQEIIKILDAFIFYDIGSVTTKIFSAEKLRASVGGGLRLDIGNRTPIVVGWGYLLNSLDRKERNHKYQPFYFSMGGQF